MMESAIHAFEQTANLTDITQRSHTRNNIFLTMCSVTTGVADLGEAGHAPTAVHTLPAGKVAAFLAGVGHRVRHAGNTSQEVLPSRVFECLLEAARYPNSNFIQNLARGQVLLAVSSGALSRAQRTQLIDFVSNYKVGTDFDKAKRAKWRWNILDLLCPLNETSFQGSLVGQAFGDAVGFLVEGLSVEECHSFVEKEFVTGNILNWKTGKMGFSVGQYSDDTQLARETFVSVAQSNGRLDPVVFGLRIALMFQPDKYRIVGFGSSTAKGGEALWRGKHYSRTGTVESTGNGSAMRSAPLGLILSQYPIETLKRVTEIFSSITHPNPGCTECSIAIALAARTAMATRTLPFSVSEFLESIAQHIPSDFATQLRNIEKLVDATLTGKGSDADAVQVFSRYGGSLGEAVWGKKVSVGVRQSTLAAIYCVCCNPDDLREIVRRSVSMGGDVDTIAAMAGAVAGARGGIAATPTEYRGRINDIGTWKIDELNQLTATVYEMVRDDRLRLKLDD